MLKNCCCLVTVMSNSFETPMDYSPPGCSVHGISQARILKWVATSFSRGSSQPRGWTLVSCFAGGFFTSEPLGKSLWNSCFTKNWFSETRVSKKGNLKRSLANQQIPTSKSGLGLRGSEGSDYVTVTPLPLEPTLSHLPVLFRTNPSPPLPFLSHCILSVFSCLHKLGFLSLKFREPQFK